MTEDQFFARTKTFIEEKPACSDALEELKPGTEISLLLDGHIECACFWDGGKAHCESRPANNPDVQFLIHAEAIRRLVEIPGDNLTNMGIEILREVLSGNIEIHLKSSPVNILSHGYLGIIKKAGPDFLSFLAQHGLTHIFKVISYIKKMKRS